MIEMTKSQAGIAVPLLNSYAHEYLGLTKNDVVVAGGGIDGKCIIIVAMKEGVQEAQNFDAAKVMIDSIDPKTLQ